MKVLELKDELRDRGYPISGVHDLSSNSQLPLPTSALFFCKPCGQVVNGVSQWSTGHWNQRYHSAPLICITLCDLQ